MLDTDHSTETNSTHKLEGIVMSNHFPYQQFLDDPAFHRQLAWSIIYLSPLVFGILVLFQPSTYGKLQTQPNKRNLFGPLLPAKWCWIVFESPNWIWVLLCFWSSKATLALPNSILLGWFFLHYIHRSILYPLHMSSESKFPLGLVFATLPYCTVNGYLQSYNLCRFQEFPEDHIYSFSFLLGVTIMLLGFGLGYVSDRTLLALRSTGTYQIPRGGMFEYVSAPHFLGECLEWWGFALACHFSLAAVSFALWTMANLVPRALAQQAWYHLRFPEDYPKERKAILLFLL